MKVQTLIVFGLLILVTACSEPGNPIDKEIEAIENGLTKAFNTTIETPRTYSIEERMEYYKIPGLSIAIVIDGKLRWAKGYGIANSKTGTKVDRNTLFQAASISKPIGALAILKLADDGQINLDDNVNNYLTSWKLEENGFTTEKVPSLRLILSHNAGISVHGFEGYKQNEQIPSLDQVLNGEGNSAKIMVDSKPGEHARYSGGGYTVVQKLIEDLTGEAYETYLDRTVLKPLGMHNSTYEQPLPEKYHPNASAAYNGSGELIAGLWHNYPEKAAAGLWTTPSDLTFYLIEVMEIYHGKKGGILSPEMVSDMLTVQGGGYRGMGPEVTGDDETMEFGHLGKNAGFTNDMLGGADTKNAIVIMTNADNGGAIMSEVQRSVCSYYGINMEIPETKVVETTEVSQEYLLSLVGRYEFIVPDTGERLNQFMSLSVEKEKLRVLHESSEHIYTLEPLVNNRFLDFMSGMLLNFSDYDSIKGFKIEDWDAQLIKVGD